MVSQINDFLITTPYARKACLHVAVEGRVKNPSLHLLLLIIVRLHHLKQKETVHVALLSLVWRFLGMSSLASDLPGEKYHKYQFILIH